MATTSIVQWNCRGLRANFDELQLLIQQYNPAVICLQETFTDGSETFTDGSVNLRQFAYFSAPPKKGSIRGDVGIYVKLQVPHSQIELKSKLPAVAVQITIHRPITVCSVYLSPSSRWTCKDLLELYQELPSPVLICGDFNAHSPLWGLQQKDKKGEIIEDLLTDSDLVLLNNRSSTYLHPATGTQTAIDLTMGDPNLVLDFRWLVCDDSHGSDHFPVIIQTDKPEVESVPQRWKFTKADWAEYSNMCSSNLTSDDFTTFNNPVTAFSDALIKIAKECIPKTTGHPKKPSKPWFDKECKEQLATRNNALNQLKTCVSRANLSLFKVARAQTRRFIRQHKRETWQRFVGKINSNTPSKQIWTMIHKINGRRPPAPTVHLKVNNNLITDKKSIADTIANTISHNSSSDHYSRQFQHYKNRAERQKPDFRSDNGENYNAEFSFTELQDALQRAHDTAVGPDDIHYMLLRKLPTNAKLVLLNIFNKVWETGDFPPEWHLATVIPIPKPGKDHTDPSNYRPIALTSCMCKIMERMVNNRLVWYLESQNVLTKYQCGFRKNRCTTDHLIRLEAFIREGFIKKQHVVAIFFDLEKAYDTTWKHGIRADLHQAGLRGRLPLFISNFLKDRQFQVRVGATMSDPAKQEMGVPQGSILSVTLFGLRINSIVKNLPVGVECSLYVDDFVICYRSALISHAERQLQHCLNKLQSWCDTTGFSFSSTKTLCVHFTALRGLFPTPSLTLKGNTIPVVEETKFLGVLFDRKLSFKPHIQQLRNKCNKALNILKVVAHTEWGADRDTLLHLYRALIRSKLDYGCTVYGSARPSYLKKLDPVANKALRLCLGAFRTSPVESLQVEANEPPLALRREQLALQYTIKLKACPEHPTYNTVFSPNYEAIFNAKPNVIPTFGLRMNPLLHDINPANTAVARLSTPSKPPWLTSRPSVVWSLKQDTTKVNTNPRFYYTKFQELLHSCFINYVVIFTDGSKANTAVAAAAVAPDKTLKNRLPDAASIYSAEAVAILLALKYVHRSRAGSFLICSDSQSVLQALEGGGAQNPLISKVRIRLEQACSRNKTVEFCWVPSHVGINGNERADKAAREALQLEPLPIELPHTDFKQHIREYIRNKWQRQWNLQTNNKLHQIKPTLAQPTKMGTMTRHDEVVLCRVRIGHTHLTHSFHLRGEAKPQCQECNCPLTVEHILLTCQKLATVRQRFYTAATMQEVFKPVNYKNIICFLKSTGLYNRF